jgi:hypothetical protein
MNFVDTVIMSEKYLIGNIISHQQKQACNDSVSNKISSNAAAFKNNS